MAETNSSSRGTGAFGSDSVGSTSTMRGGDADSQQSGFMGKVRERATAQLSTQKDRAIDGLGSAARAVRQSTQQLRDQQHETVAGYVEGAADQIERLSQQLREKDVGQLLEDAQRLARRKPALFVGTAFAIGLVGARFLKSSREDEDYPGAYGYGSGEYSGAGRGRPAGDWRRRASGTEYGRTAGSTALPGSGAMTGAGTSRVSTGGDLTGTGDLGTSDLGDTSGTVGGSSTGGRSGTGKSTPRGRRSGSETERF